MNPTTGTQFLQELMSYQQDPRDVRTQYIRLRSLLERVCKNMTIKDPVEFSNLFSRLNFLCTSTDLPKRNRFFIHNLRVNANKVIHRGHIISPDQYHEDIKALADTIAHFYTVKIPKELATRLPQQYIAAARTRIKGETHTRLRVQVEKWDAQYIYAIEEEHPAEEPIRIRYNIAGLNEEFNETVKGLWKGCQLNLVETVIDKTGIYHPEFIVLEPDYLVDISSLAECYKEYGNHPLNFIYKRLEPVGNTRHMLLGNVANFFLDELINEKPGQPVDYTEAIKKVFKASPLEFSTCKDFIDPSVFATFLEDAKTQFSNIRYAVKDTFRHRDHNIDRGKTVLEPAFLSELYGIQGRLDLLESGTSKGFTKIVELKSGKAPWPQDNHTLIGPNHTAQTYLYSLVIQHVLQIPLNSLRTYIFYSKHTDGNLRLSNASHSRLREIINTRNRVVMAEYKIAHDPTGKESKKWISQINPETLICNSQASQSFLDKYIIPQIEGFKSPFEKASPLETDYFHSFYSFISREHYLDKAGESGYDGSKGVSSLWLSSYDEKQEAGDILSGLQIDKNDMTADTPSISFKVPVQDNNALPNFRKGDIVVLYERNSLEDKVTNKQVFKGTIEKISSDEIKIRFRYKQQNISLFSETNRYAIEHDFMEVSFNAMYRGLYGFLRANKDRRDLLLNQRAPLYSSEVSLEGNYGSEEINRIVQKAKAAQDYFLLLGPPGTGKTSVALSSMVEEFYLEGENILLLAYTNRAVDEICDALDKIKGSPSYVRIGSELSCDEKHRCKLLDKVITGCSNREQVRNKIGEYRVFVGTVTSIAGKPELFKLKNFSVAIVDEASQVLEPQLVGILSAKDSKGQNAVGKFILIGDHKQLPAVVLQDGKDAIVENKKLLTIGLTDRRNSLFERLYRLQKKAGNTKAWEMLNKQGRMHPEIAAFPNKAFYQNQLKPVPAPHQTAELEFTRYDTGKPLEKMVATGRLFFIPAVNSDIDQSARVNLGEARIVAALVKSVYELYKKNKLSFDPAKSLGIIAPFRSQLALLRNKIQELGIPELDLITIDTVERYQGSQRDIIIYSFTVSQPYQLQFLANTMEEDGYMVDRKLNVALTRARKQLFITGNPSILKKNDIYSSLIEFIRARKGYFNFPPLEDNFEIKKPVKGKAVIIK
jgi:hypothetical protein